MRNSLNISGWDVGGANIKAVRLERRCDRSESVHSVSLPFAMWKDKNQLEDTLLEISSRLKLSATHDLALTMTAELADIFRSKSQGVAFVCDTVKRAFPKARILALDLASNRWAPLEEADHRPLDFAANNWLASALFVAKYYPDCLLVDMGSTTTDIIPIKDGLVMAHGRDDSDRLTHGELVYTGILRTNPNTLTKSIPVNGLPCRVAAEWFASMADVHLLLGHITTAEYSCSTADGQGKTLQEAAQRLARVVCADCETLSRGQILGMARYLYECQLSHIAESLHQVLSAREDYDSPKVFAAGSGAFMIRELNRRLGLENLGPIPYTEPSALNVLPALAAASSLADQIQDIPCRTLNDA